MCDSVYLFRLLLFKQKTAYEWLMSDWSSVVCSSDLGARLFEIDTHHDLQRATEAFALLPQSPGVVHRCGNVMDRAGTYHHGQAIVLAVQDPVQSLASAGDSRRGRRIRRLLFDHLFGGAQLPEATDAQIVGKGFHGGGSCWARRR